MLPFFLPLFFFICIGFGGVLTLWGSKILLKELLKNKFESNLQLFILLRDKPILLVSSENEELKDDYLKQSYTILLK